MGRGGGVAALASEAAGVNHRENMLRAIRFEQPDHIPMSFHINAACWHHYDQSALQDLVNGIDWIAARFAGRVCVDLDIDRQRVTAQGTPAQIDALIREEVAKLGSRRGGLMMIYGLYPGVPLANVKALMDAMERYAGYYA